MAHISCPKLAPLRIHRLLPTEAALENGPQELLCKMAPWNSSGKWPIDRALENGALELPWKIAH